VAKTGAITSDASAAQARKNAAYFKKLLTGGHAHAAGHDSDAIREVDYKGHRIVIKTMYRITVDGKLFKGELGVTNDGIVHYHGMPTAGFDSAVDLMKSVIDNFPTEFGAGTGHDGHDDDEGHGGGHHHGLRAPHRRSSPRNPAKRRPRRSR